MMCQKKVERRLAGWRVRGDEVRKNRIESTQGQGVECCQCR